MKKIDSRELTPAQKKKILEKYDYTCVYCFCDADTVDHVIPWSYRRDDNEDNLVAACWKCNLIVNNKVFDFFHLKQEYIQGQLYKWINKNPIIIWTKDEIDTISYNLRTIITPSVIIVEDEAESNRVTLKLLKDGLKVIRKHF